jgi:hypothetical protein
MSPVRSEKIPTLGKFPPDFFPHLARLARLACASLSVVASRSLLVASRGAVDAFAARGAFGLQISVTYMVSVLSIEEHTANLYVVVS